jgi:hypothetical protein
MWNLLLALFFLITHLCADEYKDPSYKTPSQFSDKALSDQEMLAYLNEEIASLEDLKNKYLAKAARFQNQGDRLQFNSESLYEARVYWNMADTAKNNADQIEEELVLLRQQRDRIKQRIQLEKK